MINEEYYFIFFCLLFYNASYMIDIFNLVVDTFIVWVKYFNIIWCIFIMYISLHAYVVIL